MTDQTNRGLLIAILVVVLIVAAVSWPMGMMGRHGMRPWMVGHALMNHGRFGVALFWIGGLIRLVVWGVLVVVVLFLVRRAGGPARSIPESALDILKRRYAAGELTREQYQQMRQDLES